MQEHRDTAFSKPGFLSLHPYYQQSGSLTVHPFCVCAMQENPCPLWDKGRDLPSESGTCIQLGSVQRVGRGWSVWHGLRPCASRLPFVDSAGSGRSLKVLSLAATLFLRVGIPGQNKARKLFSSFPDWSLGEGRTGRSLRWLRHTLHSRGSLESPVWNSPR